LQSEIFEYLKPFLREYNALKHCRLNIINRPEIMHVWEQREIPRPPNTTINRVYSPVAEHYFLSWNITC
jgi:hypothetical protein